MPVKSGANRRPTALNEFLQFYAIERFLYRFGQIRFRRKFILKGAQMFRVWHEPTSRPTMDVDLLGTVENSVENLEKIVRECCAIEVEDGVIFRPETVVGSVIRKNAEFRGVRVILQGFSALSVYTCRLILVSATL